MQARNFGFNKKGDCTIGVAKTKALINFAVTAKLVCAFDFAYADCWLSDAVAQLSITFQPFTRINNCLSYLFICNQIKPSHEKMSNMHMPQLEPNLTFSY